MNILATSSVGVFDYVYRVLGLYVSGQCVSLLVVSLLTVDNTD